MMKRKRVFDSRMEPGKHSENGTIPKSLMSESPKVFIQYSCIMAILTVAIMVSCTSRNNNSSSGANSSSDNSSAGGYFQIKSAYITFKQVEGETEKTSYVLWDDYGKLYRIGDDDGATIIDETTAKGFVLTHWNKTWIDPGASYISAMLTGRMAMKYADGPYSPGYQKLPNRIVAGKECTLYSTTYGGITTIYGGWNGIKFLEEQSGTIDGTNITVNETFTATSYSETVPANSFTVPSDYRKE